MFFKSLIELVFTFSNRETTILTKICATNLATGNHHDKARLYYLRKGCTPLIGTFQSLYLLALFSYPKCKQSKF